MWLKNCWYVIAWEHEIPAGGMLSRTVLNEPILVYRTTQGLVAMEDRCCHRLAPLSKGQLEGDSVRCGYHGLKFAPDGRCIEAPGVDVIPSRARVRTYPVASHNRWVFVWMGEPERADKALLPDNFSCDHPDWVYKPGYLHYDTPYLLIADNLLDFSHLSYVHADTLGGSTEIAQAKVEIERVPQGIRTTRRVPDVPPSPFWQTFQRFEGNVDRWFIYDFLLPGTLLMSSGGRPVGNAPDDLRGGVEMHSCQTLTPETETTTHYFFQQAHRRAIEDPAVTDAVYAGLLQAFEEDRDMITAQFETIRSNPDAPMLAMPMDVALIQFRRLLEAGVAAERAAAAGS
ncbi:MAG: Rieske 2Fe-2S domain-containing protein [Pigmentiphaga sp.]|nr:Rieske 2Fe-2S domain-containing protein [Pigmentiphaga sp.]